MQYVIFNPDRAVSGCCPIEQAYKLYLPPGDHEKLLNERGLSYATDDQANGFPSHEQFCFDLQSKSIKQRDGMACTAQSPVKCGSNAVITGIPEGSRIAILLDDGTVAHSIDKLDGDELEFNTDPFPATYTAIISQFPWADCTVKIEAQ